MSIKNAHNGKKIDLAILSTKKVENLGIPSEVKCNS